MEIYNPGTNPAILAGVTVTNAGSGANYRIPDSDPPILPHAYRVVYFNAVASTNELHTGFSLNSTGDALALLSSSGEILDSVNFGLQAADFSIGRVPEGDPAAAWRLTFPTPGGRNAAATLGSQAKLHINEWMAKSSSGNDWLELYNEESLPVSLESLVLSDQKSTPATNRPMRALSFMAPDGFVQFFASNLAKPAANQLDFKLAAKGASIYLYGPDRTKVLDKVKFAAQQAGVSEGFLPDGGTNVFSFVTGKSTPGATNFREMTNLVINELLSHTDPPFEDAVELYNPSEAPADIGGWWMSNQRSNPWRFRIPASTVIPPHSFHVLYEYQFKYSNPSFPNFTFNSAHGDHCYITAADSAGALTGIQTHVSFGAAAHGVSFGRLDTTVNREFVAMTSTTFGVDAPASVADFQLGTGRTNSPPLVGPMVISEIMYHSQDVGTGTPLLGQYIEFQNIAGAPVDLFNPLTYAVIPSAITNSWRIKGSVDFQFPMHMTVPSGGMLLVVGFDPIADSAELSQFRQNYNLPSDATILGPWKGSLGYAGTIDVYKPDTLQEPPHPDAGYLPSVLVEHVGYSDSSPWPAAANGEGASLQRRRLDGFGNDPAQWRAAPPSPGRAASPDSVIASLYPDRKLVISFEASPGLSYVLQSTSKVDGGVWQTLSPVILLQKTTATVHWTNTIVPGSGSLFYRVLPSR